MVAVDVEEDVPGDTINADEKERASLLAAWHTRPGDQVRCQCSSYHEPRCLQGSCVLNLLVLLQVLVLIPNPGMHLHRTSAVCSLNAAWQAGLMIRLEVCSLIMPRAPSCTQMWLLYALRGVGRHSIMVWRIPHLLARDLSMLGAASFVAALIVWVLGAAALSTGGQQQCQGGAPGCALVPQDVELCRPRVPH